jgi:pimeloyl-ACP methyl ester carboxylesterase
MYGDPARITESCLHRYTDGLRVPGTMPHILAIVDCWFADMAKLDAALPGVAQVPALLVWGDRDRAVDPASATPLMSILRRSELRVVPGCGHVPYEEMPEESSRIMLDWLSRSGQMYPATSCGSQPACG